MKTIVRKSISKFKKDTFTGFIGSILKSAKKIEVESLVPFVTTLEDEFGKYSDAKDYDSTVELTAQINALADEADETFKKLNNFVKAISLLDVENTGATAQAVRSIIVKYGYVPTMSVAAKFVTIQDILDKAGKVAGVDKVGYGVPEMLSALNSTAEQYFAKEEERKALRDARKAKMASAKKATISAYLMLINVVEFVLGYSEIESLKNFQVQVNETLIRINQGNEEQEAEETELNAEDESENQETEDQANDDSNESEPCIS